MSQKKNIFVAALLMSCVSGAFAANTADLKVVGKIVPAACTPTFVGGGTVDYGDIAASSLNASTWTALESKAVDYTITCSAPLKVAFKMVDARSSSAAGGGYGLGLNGTKTVGYYHIGINQGQAMVDGEVAGVIYRAGGDTGNWASAESATASVNPNGTNYSFGAAGSLVPAAHTVFSGKLSIKPYINAANELDLADEVPLDGLSTMEVIYL